jgi:ribosomal protein L40E
MRKATANRKQTGQSQRHNDSERGDGPEALCLGRNEAANRLLEDKVCIICQAWHGDSAHKDNQCYDVGQSMLAYRKICKTRST